MDGDEAPPEGVGVGVGVGAVAAPARGYVRFSACVARELCRRVAAGERQKDICADPAMPSMVSVYRWSRDRAAFARALARARALGASVAGARIYGFCPAAANEIVARVSEGEMLTLICADPHLPSLRTVMRWRESEPEFAEDLRQARAGLAERLSDLGWRMALEATPETAYLTRVRLGQLRWTASVLGPRTHGRLKATEPPEPPQVTVVRYRHFKIEENAKGQQRVVSWTPDHQTLKPVRDREGEWTDPIDPVAKAAGIRLLIEQRRAREAPAEPRPEDPEGWC
jgi:hypothetical protein